MHINNSRLGMAALALTGALFTSQPALAPTAQTVITNPSGARGDGKKKRRTFKRYLAEIEHGKPNSRAKYRNRIYDRPKHGNAGAGRGSRKAAG